MRWLPEGEPVAVLQIIHGMNEYIRRYDAFAAYMAERGFVVVGEDHLGHGESVPEGGTHGYFCENDPATIIGQGCAQTKEADTAGLSDTSLSDPGTQYGFFYPA